VTVVFHQKKDRGTLDKLHEQLKINVLVSDDRVTEFKAGAYCAAL
jgi:hypothetical protein